MEIVGKGELCLPVFPNVAQTKISWHRRVLSAPFGEIPERAIVGKGDTSDTVKATSDRLSHKNPHRGPSDKVIDELQRT